MTREEELLSEANDAAASLRARIDRQPQATTGIPKKFEIVVSETKFEPSRLIRPVGEGTDAAAGGGGGDEPLPIPPPPGGGGGECHCESENQQVKAPGGSGHERNYCLRELSYRYLTDGTETTFEDRVASKGSNDPACGDGEETDWWYEPTEAQLEGWLNEMDEPPPLVEGESSNWNVFYFFNCTRLCEHDEHEKWFPTTDVTGSGVYLIGVCWQSA